MPSNLSRAKLFQCGSPALLQCLQRAKFLYWWWLGGRAGRGATEANCAGACHPEHAQTRCLVKGNPAVTATEQSTMSPSTGQGVHSLKGTLNPEEASISAACPNLPVSPKSQSSNLRPNGLVPWGTVEGKAAWLAPELFGQWSSPVRRPSFPALSPCCQWTQGHQRRMASIDRRGHFVRLLKN